MTIKSAVQFGQNALKESSPTALTDSKVLLQQALGVDKTTLQRRYDQIMTDSQLRKFQNYLAKRQELEPIAYIVGEREFFGIPFFVDRRVLIPRPETELLVETALRELPTLEEPLFIDIGTGSGNIAVTVAKLMPMLPVIATDISREALQVAARNARNQKVERQIAFRPGKLLSPLRVGDYRGRTVVMAANLPYVPDRYRAWPDLAREPELAFFAGEDGLDVYREFLPKVATREWGRLLLFMEIDDGQGAKMKRLVRESLPMATVELFKDYLGHERLLRVELDGSAS